MMVEGRLKVESALKKFTVNIGNDFDTTTYNTTSIS